MRHLAHVLAHKNLKHILHPVVKHHIRHAKRHTISGRGTPAHLKGGAVVRGTMKPLKFKF